MQVSRFLKLADSNLTIELSFDAKPITALSTLISSNLTKDFSPTERALSPQFLRIQYVLKIVFSVHALCLHVLRRFYCIDTVR